MRRSDARVTWLSVLLVAATGLGYAWLSWFGEGEDEFGPVQHPWLPMLLLLHVVTAPLFVFALGRLWNQHIVAKLNSGAPARRRTGLLLTSQALLMIATGYGLQVSVDAWWRVAWTWSHCVTSALFCIVFVLHLGSAATGDRT